MTPRGVAIGFAKIGWDELTVGLVETEAEFLGSQAARKLTAVRVAELVHLGWWKSNRIAVFNPLMGRPGRTQPSAAAFSDVAGVDGYSSSRIEASPYQRGLLERIRALPESERRMPTQWLEIIGERWGRLDMRFGRWHGDWTPWNMARAGGDTVILWDWERTRAEVPVGFDVLNFRIQPLITRGPATSSIIELVRKRAQAVLSAMGLDERQQEALLSLYLLEICVRHGDAQPSIAIATVRNELGHLLSTRAP